jgi:hypothetical protein
MIEYLAYFFLGFFLVCVWILEELVDVPFTLTGWLRLGTEASGWLMGWWASPLWCDAADASRRHTVRIASICCMLQRCCFATIFGDIERAEWRGLLIACFLETVSYELTTNWPMKATKSRPRQLRHDNFMKRNLFWYIRLALLEWPRFFRFNLQRLWRRMKSSWFYWQHWELDGIISVSKNYSYYSYYSWIFMSSVSRIWVV